MYLMQTNNAATNDNASALPSYGSKYNNGRDIVDIAKLVRSDIANAIKAGLLPKGLKTGVRIERFSMGRSLNVKITAAPGVCFLSVARVRFDMVEPHEFTRLPLLSPAGKRIIETLEAIMNAYNRNDSDIMSDYHNVSFYGGARFSGSLEGALRAEIVAAVNGAQVAS